MAELYRMELDDEFGEPFYVPVDGPTAVVIKVEKFSDGGLRHWHVTLEGEGAPPAEWPDRVQLVAQEVVAEGEEMSREWLAIPLDSIDAEALRENVSISDRIGSDPWTKEMLSLARQVLAAIHQERTP